MRFSTAVSALSLPVFAAAQYYGPAPGPAGGSSSSSTSSAPAAPSAPPSTTGFVNVDVAAGGNFVFNPNNFNASNGTVVTFYFPTSAIQHSVTQSSFANPCTPLAANSTTGGSQGFDSGLTQADQFSITITNDQIPIWFHCKQQLHCGMYGMVGAINAPATGQNTFTNFMANAKAIGGNEPIETDSGPVLAGNAATATASPANTATASAAASGSGSGSPSSASHVVASSVLALVGAAVSMIFFV